MTKEPIDYRIAYVTANNNLKKLEREHKKLQSKLDASKKVIADKDILIADLMEQEKESNRWLLFSCFAVVVLGFVALLLG